MNWEKCRAEKIIKPIEPDRERVINMLKMIELRQTFWDSLSRITHENYTSLVVEAYYEIIKELLIAFLNLNGFDCSNHECLIRYFQLKHPDLGVEAEKIDELRRVRNKIDYKGFFVKKEFFERNKIEYHHIIDLLKKLVKEKLL